MDNIYLVAMTIAIIFLITKFIEMRFVIKENKNFKTLIIDTIIVYLSVIFGYFVVEQFGDQTKNLTEAPVFVDQPKF